MTKPRKIMIAAEEVKPLNAQSLSPQDRKMRETKLEYLTSTNLGLKYFENARDLKELSQRVMAEVKVLLDPKNERGIGIALLMSRGTEYQEAGSAGLPKPVSDLNLSLPKSILRSAAEHPSAINRGILYIPSLSAKDYYLATEFDSYNRSARAMEKKKHEVYLGSFETYRQDLDRASLEGIEAVAVIPIIKHSQKPALGAIFLTGPEHFLDPLIDLIPLRVMADQLVGPISRLNH